MIVENQVDTIQNASRIADLLLKQIGKECESSQALDDPAEHIYLTLHTIAILTSRVCLILEKYGEIYNISNLTVDKLMKWMIEIINENIAMNKA